MVNIKLIGFTHLYVGGLLVILYYVFDKVDFRKMFRLPGHDGTARL